MDITLNKIIMKNLIVAALLSIGVAAFAQEKTSKEGRIQRGEIPQLSLEQRNQLELKKMTLELDLTASQQKEMASIIADQNAKKEAMKENRKKKKIDFKNLTAEERFAMKNKILDDQIAHKEKLKKVLTPVQLEKWEKLKKDQRTNFQKRNKKHHLKKHNKDINKK